jgi:tetratricopeptide (TPR) repeat protein
LNTDEVPVASFSPGGPEQIWFGHEPNLIPHPVKPLPGTTRSEASRAYLKKATEHYRTALELNPGSLLARLGHGWALEQAGDQAGAIAEYRRVIEQAWRK